VIAVARLREADRGRLLRRPGVVTPEVLQSAASIVEAVRVGGDAAVRRFTKEFDRVDLDRFDVAEAEFAAAEKALSKAERAAIREAQKRVADYHRQGLPDSFERTAGGITLGKRVVPYDVAGIYIPGGLAVYPSSLVMCAAPAKVAGVKMRVLCTPPGPDGSLPAAVLFAARVCGVERVFKIGGAQAIAAMACGTATVPRAGIIVGPGNRFVTAAKKLVREEVAIDFLAGPTEVLIIADAKASPAWVAADLIAQAEHDPLACPILVTTSEAHAKAVDAELDRQVPGLDRRTIIEKSLRGQGALLVADSLEEAIDFANDYGAEHLVIVCRNPRAAFAKVRHAGAVFLGDYSPVASGDYCVGPNSTLPTLGEARRASGLSAATFLKTISYELLTRDGLRRIAPMATTLATTEGLAAHRRSIEARLS
jgi:histidinol dehydrogenase